MVSSHLDQFSIGLFLLCCEGSRLKRIYRHLVGMIKPSTVSTAQLKTSQSLHSRPINLVVSQGSLVQDEQT